MPSKVTLTTTGHFLTGAGELRLEDRRIDPPSPGEVQIAIRSTTLCGSDIHYFKHGRNGTIEVRQPLCLGHEAAGEVVAAAKDAPFQVGDRVAVECGVPCDDCNLCLAGRYNLCSRLRFRGSGSAWPHFQGTMQTRINHPAKWARLLPSDFSYDEGALLEPLSVAVHACNRVNIKPNSSCIIIGAGAVGLLCALAARQNGCRYIAITDVVEARVRFALENAYADVGSVASSERPSSPEASLEMARGSAEGMADLLLPDGSRFGSADYTFECTGVETCVQAAIYESSAREVDIIPTWRYAKCYDRATEIVAATKRDRSLPQLEKMITHRFSGIANVREALQTACFGRDSSGNMVVKVVLNNDE